MSKDVQEIIRDTPFKRKALFLGMQFTGLVGLTSIVVACMAPPISLAVAGAGVALFAASFAGQVIFLNQEAKRQEKEEDTDSPAKKYSPKRDSKDHSKPTREDALFYKPEYIQMPTQKQVSKAQTSDIKRVTPSVRLSVAELRELQRGRGSREM